MHESLLYQLANGPDEFFEVTEVVLECPIHTATVDLEVLVNENISKSCQGRQLCGECGREHLLSVEDLKQFLIVGREIQPHIRNNVIADIQYALYRQLKIPLRIAVDQRIFNEMLLVRLCKNASEELHILANLCDAGVDNVAINQ